MPQPQLVFDIETYGHDFKTLNPIIQENFLKHLKTEEEKEEIKTRTGLFPISGEIVAIAMLNPESKNGKVYFQSNENGIKDYEKDGVEYIVKDEKGILEAFWNDIKFYQQIISFNGRSFDAPFIIFRSIIHKIQPTKNLIPNRYNSNEHLDLLDRLSFYGAFRRFSLEVLCQSFGIKNPKDQGVSGLEVNNLFENKEYKKIAEYCMRDVVATADLYQRVKEFIF